MRRVALLLFLLQVAIASRSSLGGVKTHPKWTADEETVPDHSRVQFSVHLPQTNLDKLEKLFWKVSDPKSRDFGRYRDMQELHDLTAPAPESFRKIERWLHSVQRAKIRRFDNHFSVELTARDASQLFQAPVRMWTHVDSGHRQARFYGDITVPTSVREHIHLVSGGLMRFHNAKRSLKRTPPRPHAEPIDYPYYRGYNSTLAALRRAYNITMNSTTTGQVIQVIYEFGDYYTPSDLRSFYRANNINSTLLPIARGTNCISKGCDTTESNLDVQYMMGTAANTKTYFLNFDPSVFMLEALQDTLSFTRYQPTVISMSWGGVEYVECPNEDLCQYDLQSDLDYANATDVLLMKFGVAGTSVVVSSGDNGALNFLDTSGNCPLDNQYFCPGYDYACDDVFSSCQQVLVTFNGTTVSYPNSYTSGFLDPSLVDVISSDNQACNVSYVSIEGRTTVLTGICTCDQLIYNDYLLNGTLYQIRPYTFNSSNGSPFEPGWPASSPYLTSVGGTILLDATTEIFASYDTGSIIAGGGGFSKMYPQPSYQKDFVQQWMNGRNTTFTPLSSFNSSNRAYPDISLSAHAYPIYDGGSVGFVDGTSASAPLMGGILSLINDRLIALGYPTLGFINPLLYHIASDRPDIYRDITSGKNNWSSATVCQIGFDSAEGWDPVTGLGSPNVGLLTDYIIQLYQQTHTTKTTSAYSTLPIDTVTELTQSITFQRTTFTRVSPAPPPRTSPTETLVPTVPVSSSVSLTVSLLLFVTILLST
ncbi:hypothetical protein PROFUN_02342 [Planoprotostelium fungivorum]|uniref:Peptidase S53 domain-containing protein n=1 Tax=Planoprotostelium fungivorum TaxID=1890364 RepID=A0A2P6NYN2_9EUKA|nr:hypothetical protein PROFUN_02342 [Planoprotostelium fungivorum]